MTHEELDKAVLKAVQETANPTTLVLKDKLDEGIAEVMASLKRLQAKRVIWLDRNAWRVVPAVNFREGKGHD